MKRIGIFAGVFDPIHLGHTRFMSQAIEERKLDKVYVLVEKEPKYKTCLATYRHRSNMVELAIKAIPQAEVYESVGRFFPITSTLPKIRADNPDAKLFLLLGDDVAEHINEWPDSKEILKDVRLVVAERGKDDHYSKISSLKVREGIKNGSKNLGVDEAVLNYSLDNDLY